MGSLRHSPRRRPRAAIVCRTFAGLAATTNRSDTLTPAWKSGGADFTDARLGNRGASFNTGAAAGERRKPAEAPFRDCDDLESGIVSDAMISDETGPNDSFALEGGATRTNRTTFDLTPAFTDPLSGVAEVHSRNRNGSCAAGNPPPASPAAASFPSSAARAPART